MIELEIICNRIRAAVHDQYAVNDQYVSHICTVISIFHPYAHWPN